jgi:hypothetical protein
MYLSVQRLCFMWFKLQKKHHHFKIKKLLKWEQHIATFLFSNVACQCQLFKNI